MRSWGRIIYWDSDLTVPAIKGVDLPAASTDSGNSHTDISAFEVGQHDLVSKVVWYVENLNLVVILPTVAREFPRKFGINIPVIVPRCIGRWSACLISREGVAC